MRSSKHFLFIVGLFGSVSAFASGPEVITSVTLVKNIACDGGGFDCMAICYKAEDGFGGRSSCSQPEKIGGALDGKLAKVKAILKADKEAHGNELQYEMGEVARAGERLMKEFSAEQFLDSVIREDELRHVKPVVKASPAPTSRDLLDEADGPASVPAK